MSLKEVGLLYKSANKTRVEAFKARLHVFKIVALDDLNSK